MNAAVKGLGLALMVLLAGIAVMSTATAQNTVSWNHGDLKITVDETGTYNLMSKITNHDGTTGTAYAKPIYLVAGKDNTIGIGNKAVEHIADGRGPNQFVMFWLQTEGNQVSNTLRRPN